MASSVKYSWRLKKYAKFLYEDDWNEYDEEAETMDVPCKGTWRLCSGESMDLILSYLESDHFLLSRGDIILESFSLINSKSWIKGVAKEDSLLLTCQLKEGNVRRFRIQFDAIDGKDGTENRKQCTAILEKHFPISDYACDNGDMRQSEVSKLDGSIFDKLKLRKGYSVEISDENLKEIVTLCMTDSSFPT
ncbi:Meiotic recombination protein REC114-like protein, partial [Stegodyphus mimosarum]